MWKLWRKFLALFRLDLSAVCDQSAGMGLIDYHDYPDSQHGEPWHFYVMTCRRCGKQFTI
jgi:hypothetical protein